MPGQSVEQTLLLLEIEDDKVDDNVYYPVAQDQFVPVKTTGMYAGIPESRQRSTLKNRCQERSKTPDDGKKNGRIDYRSKRFDGEDSTIEEYNRQLDRRPSEHVSQLE
ncbi:MAG: hypothetical protein Q9190_005310 [Brigantiaea leucoxantha]